MWYKSCENASIKKKLAQLNRLICSCLMPLHQSALNIMPLHLCMAKSALNTYVRVRKIVKPTWDQIGSNSKIGHLLRCQKDLSNLGITLVDQDRDFYLNIDRKYVVDLESKTFGLPHYDSTLKCYTDGSRMKVWTWHPTNLAVDYVL